MIITLFLVYLKKIVVSFEYDFYNEYSIIFAVAMKNYSQCDFSENLQL